MKKSYQLRVRLPANHASQWLLLPPTVRSKAIAILLSSANKIDLLELVNMRRELSNLGNLLNQSLSISRGQTVDEAALNSCIKLLSSLLK